MISHIPSGGAYDHGDDGDDQKMIKCFTFRKEEREKQNSMEINANVYHRGMLSVIKTL
jgi:hypothetical protein